MSRETESIEDLLRRSDWEKARRSIERALAKRPDDHWLLTQLGVTYYEQQRYREALGPLMKSFDLVPDCPLTLWNIAGAVDALGQPKLAIEFYKWLLAGRKSSADDPCWESADWTERLQSDCVYRIGVCFRHLNRRKLAEHCFRQYVDLFLNGACGSYAIDDAARHIRAIRETGKRSGTKATREAIDAALKAVGGRSLRSRRRALPELERSIEELTVP